ncbi:hypothetical protein [Abiotrophia defectiva]
MIIYLTKTSGGKVAVNFNMVTFIEDCGEESEVYFPYASISVKETLDEIRRKVFYGKKR